MLHLDNTEDHNDSLSAPSTPAQTWAAERIVKLIEPWKKSLSQSADHIPKARGNSRHLIDQKRNYMHLEN